MLQFYLGQATICRKMTGLLFLSTIIKLILFLCSALKSALTLYNLIIVSSN